MRDRVRWVRGRDDPVTGRRQIGLPAGATYRPATDEIHLVVARDGDGAVEETTEPVAEWAERECARVAAGAVPPAVGDRTATDGTVSAVVRRGEDLPASRVVIVSYTPEPVEEGADDPDLSTDFERVVAAAPQRSHATVEFRGEQFTCELPVYVECVARGRRL